MFFFFFSSRRRHTRWNCDWSSDVCSSDLDPRAVPAGLRRGQVRRWAVDIEIAMDEAAAAVVDLARHKDQLPAGQLSEIVHLLQSLGWEIGRASCRERV